MDRLLSSTSATCFLGTMSRLDPSLNSPKMRMLPTRPMADAIRDACFSSCMLTVEDAPTHAGSMKTASALQRARYHDDVWHELNYGPGRVRRVESPDTLARHELDGADLTDEIGAALRLRTRLGRSLRRCKGAGRAGRVAGFLRSRMRLGHRLRRCQGDGRERVVGERGWHAPTAT